MSDAPTDGSTAAPSSPIPDGVSIEQLTRDAWPGLEERIQAVEVEARRYRQERVYYAQSEEATFDRLVQAMHTYTDRMFADHVDHIVRGMQVWGNRNSEGWAAKVAEHEMNVHGGEVEERFREVEQNVRTVQMIADTAHDMIVELKAKYEVVATGLQELHDRAPVSLAGTPPPPGLELPEPKQQRMAPPRPLEERTIARIGNLGWDTAGRVLIARAKQVLLDAGVDECSWHNMSAVRDPGSVVQLAFRTRHELDRAQFLIKDASIRTQGHGKYVWLDLAKSREEMLPARTVHRLHDVLQNQIEPQLQTPIELKKVLNGKQIKTKDDVLVAWTIKGEIQWSVFAKGRYDATQRQLAAAHAED